MARFQYDAEFPEAFEYWMQRQGLGADARTPRQVDRNNPPLTWAQLYWRVKWRNISPQEAFAMFHRLRANRLARFGLPAGQLREFTYQDMLDVLKINDFAPPFRSQLAAINSTLLTRVDINRAYQLRVIDRAEVLEQYKDRGYTPADAEILTRYVETVDRVRRSKTYTRRTKAQVLESWNLGLMTRTAAGIALYELQFEDPQKLLDFRALPQNDKEFRALQDPAIRVELANAEFERQQLNAKRIIAVTRKLYLQAALRDDETRNRLAAIGVQSERIEEWLLSWAIERQGPRKLLTARQIQTAVGTGVLTYQVGYFRLVLLGYLPEDARTLLAQSQRSLALAQAKAAQAQAKSVAQQQRAAAAAVKALASESKAAQQELARFAAPAQLVKWYAKGYLDGRILEQRLAAILADPVKVASYIDEARDARAARTAAAP